MPSPSNTGHDPHPPHDLAHPFHKQWLKPSADDLRRQEDLIEAARNAILRMLLRWDPRPVEDSTLYEGLNAAFGQSLLMTSLAIRSLQREGLILPSLSNQGLEHVLAQAGYQRARELRSMEDRSMADSIGLLDRTGEEHSLAIDQFGEDNAGDRRKRDPNAKHDDIRDGARTSEATNKNAGRRSHQVRVGASSKSDPGASKCAPADAIETEGPAVGENSPAPGARTSVTVNEVDELDASLVLSHKELRAYWRGRPLKINSHSDFQVLACLEEAEGGLVPYLDLLKAAKPDEPIDKHVTSLKAAPHEVDNPLKRINRALRELEAPVRYKAVRGQGVRRSFLT